MTVHHGITIAGSPGHRTFTFDGAASRMHKRGHMWFNKDVGSVTVQLSIDTANWVFENNGTSDGALAFWISKDCNPATKTQFRDYGVFGPPTLDATFTKLTFISSNDDEGVYYYMLRFKRLSSPPEHAVCDPIIHNT
jgi:hypothetical protein